MQNLKQTLQDTQNVIIKASELVFEDNETLIMLHAELVKVLAYLKYLEGVWRAKLIADCFPVHEAEGTETLELGEGWKLKAEFKNGYKVEEATIKDDLQKVSDLGLAYSEAVRGLIKYKPELSVTVYKTLSDEIKDIVNNSLTIKPGTPTLKLIEPKGK